MRLRPLWVITVKNKPPVLMVCHSGDKSDTPPADIALILSQLTLFWHHAHWLHFDTTYWSHSDTLTLCLLTLLTHTAPLSHSARWFYKLTRRWLPDDSKARWLYLDILTLPMTPFWHSKLNTFWHWKLPPLELVQLTGFDIRTQPAECNDCCELKVIVLFS